MTNLYYPPNHTHLTSATQPRALHEPHGWGADLSLDIHDLYYSDFNEPLQCAEPVARSHLAVGKLSRAGVRWSQARRTARSQGVTSRAGSVRAGQPGHQPVPHPLRELLRPASGNAALGSQALPDRSCRPSRRISRSSGSTAWPAHAAMRT